MKWKTAVMYIHIFNLHKHITLEQKSGTVWDLTRIPSGESIWGSRSKKDRLLKNQ